MIADPPYDAWAQTGYIRDARHNGGAMSSFSQYIRPGFAPVTKWFSGPGTNSVHSYQSYVGADGYIVLWIDQYQVDKTNFEPSAYWGAQPWSSQYSEETGHCATDVPGLVSYKVHFTSVKYQRPSDSLWLVPYPTAKARDCGTTYNNNVVDYDKFDFWTANP
jgi:hypothetical protein